MNGIHDLGGMHGFGRVVVERDEPVFHARWEGRVLGMMYQVVGFGWATLDAFRHGIERMDPVDYLTAGYYGRWLAAVERLLVERGVLAPGDVDAEIAGVQPPAPSPMPAPSGRAPGAFVRTLDRPPRFAAGESVRTRVGGPAGHTRLPRYAAGRRGTVHRVHPPHVFPDTNAHGLGEHPQYLYTVRFQATELWGETAEPRAWVHLDLFEPYLEKY
jgi:nitrile hydratase